MTETVAGEELGEPAELEQLGLDLSAPDAADTLRLVRYLLEQGADREEVKEAVMTGTTGPLALDLALRGRGGKVPFPEAAVRAGLETEEAAALWRALGFPDPLSSSATLTASETNMLRVLALMARSVMGRETGLQLARVIGSSLATIAEAIVDAYRVRVEMPRRLTGESRAQVVEDYARTTPVLLTALDDAIKDILRIHVLAVSRAAWALDESQATVTRELTVGFADLVGYTRSARSLSAAELAEAIDRFEALVGEVVSAHGGRVVKLIGDEAMFAVDDPLKGCELASELVRMIGLDGQLSAVRIGISAGPVVAVRGDYYGDVVNLAARLVKVAAPGEILVSQELADAVSPQIEFERVEVPPLKGYDRQVTPFRIGQA
jgi:adenylate cyclase